jgi:putative ABC transport system permease protein
MWIMGNRPNLPVLDQPTFFYWFENIDADVKQTFYSSTPLFFHPASILGCLIVAGVIKIAVDFLLCSEFGIVLRGVGQNEQGTRYHHRNPGTYKLAGLALANASAAFAGAIAAQYQGFSDVNMGVGVIVLALVAVILGQELFARIGWDLSSPGSLTRAALIGIIVYQVLLAGVLRAGVPPTSLRLFAGLSLVAAVVIRSRRRALTFSW